MIGIVLYNKTITYAKDWGKTTMRTDGGKKHPFTLRTKIIALSIIICIIPMAVLYSVLFRNLSDSIRRQAEDFCFYSAENLSSLVNREFDNAHSISLAVIANSVIRECMKEMDEQHQTLTALRNTALNMLHSIVGNVTSVRSVSVFSMNGFPLIYGRSGVLTAEDREKADSLQGMYFWNIETEGSMKGEPYLCCLLREEETTSVHWGYVKVYLRKADILEMLSNPEGKLTSQLIDGSGQILLQTSPETERKETEIEQIRQLNHCGWMLKTSLEESYLYDGRRVLYSGLAVTLTVAAMTAVLLSILLSHMLVRPLRRIRGAMVRVGNGEFGTHIEPQSKDELGEVTVQLNRMSDELERLMKEGVENRTLLTAAKLRVLQGQINPHFLYNTLDNIHWMSDMHHTEDVSRMVAALSSLFRLSLSLDDSGVWPFAMECRHVNCYLDIMRIRHQDTIAFEMRVQEGLDGIPVPALLLQPLLENAIQHGCAGLEHGEVTLEVRTENGMLLYRVSDNGNGDGGTINQMIQNGPADGNRKGMGLHNLYQRLVLRFGNAASFVCRSGEGRCVFEIRMPLAAVRKTETSERGDEA